MRWDTAVGCPVASFYFLRGLLGLYEFGNKPRKMWSDFMGYDKITDRTE